MSTPWVPSPDDNVVPIRPSAYDEPARPRGASDAVPVRPAVAGGLLGGGPSVGGLSGGGPSGGGPSGGGPSGGVASRATGSAGARGAGHREDSWRRGSATSFGIVGRLVITAGLLAILALIAVGNLLGVPVYLVFLGWALRDLWVRPRRRASTRPVSRQAGAPDVPWARSRRATVPRDGS